MVHVVHPGIEVALVAGPVLAADLDLVVAREAALEADPEAVQEADRGADQSHEAAQRKELQGPEANQRERIQDQEVDLDLRNRAQSQDKVSCRTKRYNDFCASFRHPNLAHF